MHRNIRLLALFNFFTDLDLLAPVAIIYFTRVAGSFTLGMSIFSIVMLSQAVFELPTGIFSDLIGRKKTIIAGSLAGVLSALSLAIGHTYLFLVVSAVLAGLTRSFYSGNNEALLYETLAESNQKQHYHTYLGKLSSVFQVALAISAVAGSLLAAWSFTILVWVRVVPNIIRLAISFFLLEPQVHTKQSSNVFAHLGESLRLFALNQKLRLLTVTSVLRFSLGESVFVFRSVFVNSIWPLWAVGISNFISHIGAAAGYFFSEKVINRFTSSKVLNFEIIGNRAINLIALLFPTAASPALMGATSISYGVSEVAQQSLLQHEFSENQRATMGSLNALSKNIGFAITSIGLGVVADLLGITPALIITQLLLLVPLFFYRKIFKNEK